MELVGEQRLRKQDANLMVGFLFFVTLVFHFQSPPRSYSNHVFSDLSGVPVGKDLRARIRRFHVATWFGVCGYSKMKGRKVKPVVTCVACHSEMVRKHHWGKRVIARDIGDPLYQKWFVDDEFDGSGLPNYVDAVGGRVE